MEQVSNSVPTMTVFEVVSCFRSLEAVFIEEKFSCSKRFSVSEVVQYLEPKDVGEVVRCFSHRLTESQKQRLLACVSSVVIKYMEDTYLCRDDDSYTEQFEFIKALRQGWVSEDDAVAVFKKLEPRFDREMGNDFDDETEMIIEKVRIALMGLVSNKIKSFSLAVVDSFLFAKESSIQPGLLIFYNGNYKKFKEGKLVDKKLYYQAIYDILLED